MALTYEESSELMKDQAFIGRVKVASLKYAAYIANEAADVPAHNTRYRWAQNTMNAPDVAAANIAPTVTMDDKVQTDGAAISDPDLQVAVENAVNKLI